MKYCCKSFLHHLGIYIEEFGPQTVQITHMPVILGRRVDPGVIEELIDDLGSLAKRKDAIITRMACRASPKAGDTISVSEGTSLLSSLYEHQLTWTCPHGRPVMLFFSVDKLGKLFHRHE